MANPKKKPWPKPRRAEALAARLRSGAGKHVDKREKRKAQKLRRVLEAAW